MKIAPRVYHKIIHATNTDVTQDHFPNLSWLRALKPLPLQYLDQVYDFTVRILLFSLQVSSQSAANLNSSDVGVSDELCQLL